MVKSRQHVRGVTAWHSAIHNAQSRYFFILRHAWPVCRDRIADQDHACSTAAFLSKEHHDQDSEGSQKGDAKYQLERQAKNNVRGKRHGACIRSFRLR
jgi:hypothetical protein